jgi:hypothetical protein
MKASPMGCERTINIWVDEKAQKAVVDPVSPVVPGGCTIRWVCDVGHATITIPDLGEKLTADPGVPGQVIIEESCYYFVAVTDEDGRKVGTMAVIIIDH